MKMKYFSEIAGYNTTGDIIVEDNLYAKLISTEKKRINIVAMGDVGGNILLGFHLLGETQVESIGIYDIVQGNLTRWEAEIYQIAYPGQYDRLPMVRIIEEKELFDCDVFLFCASKGVPPVNTDIKDVRMAQLQANIPLVEYYAKQALTTDFKGLFAVISDPVDQLCEAAARTGLNRRHIKGFGLGVMNARAAYYAKKYPKFDTFLTEGRAFGPHGQDLVIANSISNYDNELSVELTQLVIKANLVVRESGFKPFVAPAFSSAVISILLMLRGEWHYSSTTFGQVYFGARNRITKDGDVIENLQLPSELYERIENAYKKLLA